MFTLEVDDFDIILLEKEVPAIGVADGQVRAAFEQAKWHFLVMIDNGVFTDPVEGGHEFSLAGIPRSHFLSIPDEYPCCIGIYFPKLYLLLCEVGYLCELLPLHAIIFPSPEHSIG